MTRRWWQPRCRARLDALGARCIHRRPHDGDHQLSRDYWCWTWRTVWTGRLAEPPRFDGWQHNEFAVTPGFASFLLPTPPEAHR